MEGTLYPENALELPAGAGNVSIACASSGSDPPYVSGNQLFQTDGDDDVHLALRSAGMVIPVVPLVDGGC